ncbi:MAG: dimethylargininase [Actinobacteria bacterium]|nr:dimethylargininase [Actinomycetota bacterium]
MPDTAYLRAVPDAFAACVTSVPAVPPLDPALARRQHAAYREALEAGGFVTVVVPADEAHPDGSFVEDTAVVIGGAALATRPGHRSRRGEVGPVAAVLAGTMPVSRMRFPGRLDGGDVLQVAGRVFVGVGSRTNAAGVAALERFARGSRLVPVPVAGVLHLKSAVTALDDGTVLVEPGRVDESVFEGLRLVRTAPGEAHAGNVVRLPDGRILATAAAPRTAGLIADAGFEVTAVDVSEFARADGGLTCLSIRVRGGR